MKIAKVISTCFKRGRIRINTQLTGDPLGFFSHSQNFSTVTDTINLINYQLQMEEKYPPGIERDIIIVNNDVGSIEGNEFINEINNKQITGGKIFSITRNNIGLAFGAYNSAFEKFKDRYDFFFFIEDDQITASKDYLKIGIDKWNETSNCGFIAYIGVSKVFKGWWKMSELNEKNAFVGYGGCGLTSTKVLNEIVDKYGCIPHNKKDIDQTNAIAFGEIAFSKSFIDLGYKLIEFNEKILVVPAYDLMRGIRYRKYPNFFEKIIWFSKVKIYNLFSKSSFFLKIYLILLQKIKKFYK
jgi:hypothetical protein